MLKKLCLVLAVASLVVGIATFPAYGSFKSKAKLIQRVEKSQSDSLFGETGTPIGEPQELIIEDPKAFIGEPKDGVYQVDEGYLKANNIYPRQLKTVDFLLSNIRLGAFVAAMFFVVIGLWLGKRAIKSQA